MPESWDVSDAKTKPICCGHFMAVLPLLSYFFMFEKGANYDVAAMSMGIMSHFLSWKDFKVNLLEITSETFLGIGNNRL